MSRTVHCIKLGHEAEGLDRPPYPGDLGRRVFEQVSKPAWAEWLRHQTMLINENRLSPMDPKARKFLEEQMERYFFGEGAEKPAGYVPPISLTPKFGMGDCPRRNPGFPGWSCVGVSAMVARPRNHRLRKTPMRKTLIAFALASLSGTLLAADMATPDEAKALSQKAQAAVNEMGKDKAFAAFAAPDGGFRSKDLYVFCMDMDGVMLSHALKPDLVGKNLFDFNKYGDEPFKKMVATAKTSGEGAVDYKWPYPGTDEIRDKESYVMTNKEGFFCGVGAYK